MRPHLPERPIRAGLGGRVMGVMRKVSAALVLAALVPGCSSRPREYRATIAPPPSAEAQARFRADEAECRQLLVAGKLDKDGRLASVGAGAAAGAATMAGGAALATAMPP